LNELKGVDDVLHSLHANIAVPLENDELANELGLKPKRGVLLAGPPGTGKTTVGRALAHRLKGKFFLIDGTFISGTRDFYGMVHRVFEAAKDNAPSVIFIDDSDVIFESGQEHGLYRYLLTMLDGLESESAGRVCVMMTAMDVGNLPPALVRSGRIELWLEMRLPCQEARTSILKERIGALPAPLNHADVDRLVEASDGFTGADLKRTVEDAKALYAFDRLAGAAIKEMTTYYLAAAETVRASKERYARAEARANATRAARPSWFNPFSEIPVDDANEE
jgi:transitional endoplasmic reticulum ATPase